MLMPCQTGPVREGSFARLEPAAAPPSEGFSEILDEAEEEDAKPDKDAPPKQTSQSPESPNPLFLSAPPVQTPVRMVEEEAVREGGPSDSSAAAVTDSGEPLSLPGAPSEDHGKEGQNIQKQIQSLKAGEGRIPPAKQGAQGHGTDAAQAVPAVNKALKENNFAGLFEQNLPEQVAHASEALAHRILADPDFSVPPPEQPALIAWNFAPAPGASELKEMAPVLEAHSGVLEQTLARAVLEQAAIVRWSGARELAVVLKPDGATEILLHVTKQNGSIQAQAKCERGDFELLNSHWNHLRESLAQRGIELKPLQPGSAPGFTPNSNQHQSRNFARDPEPSAAPAPRNKTEKLQSRVRPQARSGLLESWA